MLLNYLKTAFRNLRKNKIISSINFLGLAFGIACSLLVMLWIIDEKSVDAFHQNKEQLYTIIEKQYSDGKVNAFFGGPGLLADEMKRKLPDVEYASNFAWNETKTFQAAGKIIKESGNHAGADFFKMFSYPLLAGNVSGALNQPAAIAISKKMADEFFGSPAAAIGKTIKYENRQNFQISAVFDNLPSNSSLQFDYLINWESFIQSNPWMSDWSNNGPQTYLMLRRAADGRAFAEKINRFLDNYNKEQTPHSYVRLFMEHYGDVYLHGSFKAGNLEGGRILYVRLFGIIGIFILLIACVNFMNLTTARSVQRAREIGVRKVMGALRFALVQQFITEAIVMAWLATYVAMVLAALVLPGFNQLTHKKMEIPFASPWFWLGILGLQLLTGIISGSYPAFYLSSFKPVRVLKSAFRFSGGALWFRKGLVVFQFMLSILLIIGTLVVNRQVNYIENANVGYDRQDLVYLPAEGDLLSKYTVFKDKALQLPGISAVTRMTDAPTLIENGTGGIDWPGKNPDADIEFSYASVGYDFQKVMHFTLAQGRDFSKDFASDSVGYLINESALKLIGYKDPIGKPLSFWGKKGTIIGVMKDFHFNSLHEPINPMVLRLGEDVDFGDILIRTRSGRTAVALSGLQAICKELNPQFPFSYRFADEDYQNLYASEDVVRKLSNYFATLAIFISCLGLLGLVMFTAEQRTKEFGIRKTLGASPVVLFSLLSREFLQLVTIALVIATPLAWYVMNNWLANYAYHVAISWWIFAVAGLLAIAIALLTISFQSIKVAIANPVKNLRIE